MEAPTFGVIYLATNRTTGKRYVGQTTQPMMTRWRRHVSDALGPKERPHPLHNSIRKHGPDAWSVECIAVADNRDALNALEAMLIDMHGTSHPDGYNLKPGGNSAGHHPDTKDKLSAALRGRQLPREQRERMRVVGRTRQQTPNQLAGMAKCLERNRAIAGKPGTPHTDDARTKMSAARSGKPKSAEHRAAIGAAHVGMKRSPEAVANMRAAWVLRKQRAGL